MCASTVSRPTNSVNVYVSNLAPSGTIPPGWTFTMYNSAYVGQSGFWNMQVVRSYVTSQYPSAAAFPVLLPYYTFV